MFKRFRLALSTTAVSCAAVVLPCTPVLADELNFADKSPIVVSGARRVYQPASATKTNTPLIDVPQSVTVLSRDQLDDQGLGQLGDALRYVPGVILGMGEGHRDEVALRGQSTTADFFLDGLRDDAQYYRPLYNTDRVEVLKGANAMMFGRGGGGGVINRVSKVARFDSGRGSGSAGVDSFGAWSLATDVNQPLSDSVALRFNGTYEAFASHRDVYGGHFIGAAPTLGVRLGEATTFGIGYEYADDDRVTDRGIPSLGGVPISGYDKTFFGDLALNQSQVTAHLAHARLGHAFSDSLSFNLSGRYATYDKFYGNILPEVATATTVAMTGYTSDQQRKNWIGQGNLVWKGETGPLRHTLLIGFEAAGQDTAAIRRVALFAVGGGTAISAIVPLARRIALPAISLAAAFRSTISHVRALSAYVQDQIEIGDHVQVIGGIRYDDFRITSLNRINSFAAARSDGTWSPRIGLILKPQANISLYASYARSFLPQSGDQFTVLDATTTTLAPEEFRNLEAGVKWDIRPDLSLTAAVYQLDRSNTRATDPLSGNAVLTGSSRVRGFEAALSGRIASNWQASLGYARQGGRIMSTTTAAPAGRLLPQLPKHQLTAWTRYDVTPKLGLGLGLVHQSSQFATISNAVVLPAFTRLDAAIYYDVSPAFSLQLNVENLADARYFPSAHTDNNIATGEPFNARLTVRIKF